MHGNNKDWVTKKKLLAQKQQEFNEKQKNSTKKLKRVRITSKGKVITEFELWPAEVPVLQRIANHMDRPISPFKIASILNKGEKITTRHDVVYSLVPLTATH